MKSFAALPFALVLAGCVTLSPEAARVAVYSAPLDGSADHRQMPGGCRRVANLGQDRFSEQSIEGQADPYRRQRNAVATGGGNVLLALMRQTSARIDPECPNSSPIRDCAGHSGAWFTIEFESYACTPEGLQALPVPKKPGGQPSVITAQSVAPPPRTVEAAEAEGARHPKTNATTDPAMYAEAFGPRERRCVDAEKHVTARSGDFVAGPFDTHVLMAGDLRRKVWWAPKQTAVMPPMQLRAVKIGAPEVTVAWTFSSVVSNENGFFFNTLLRFPETGKWLVVVTSGDNWGCFLLDEIDLPKR